MFFALNEDQDPPSELLDRFAGHSPAVEPVSAAEIGKGGGSRVTHEQKGGRGIILRLEAIRWIDGDTVEVDGGYYEANRSASGNTYRAERLGGKWAVTSDGMRWIS